MYLRTKGVRVFFRTTCYFVLNFYTLCILSTESSKQRLTFLLDSQFFTALRPRFHVLPEKFVRFRIHPSSETQGQSVGSGEKAGRKFSSTGERAPGYRLSPGYFQKFERMPAPDWAQKMLCIIVPNRRTVSSEFFS